MSLLTEALEYYSKVGEQWWRLTEVLCHLIILLILGTVVGCLGLAMLILIANLTGMPL